MNRMLLAAGALLLFMPLPGKTFAQQRYVEPPPVLVSPDLSAPWVTQLRQRPLGRQPGAIVRAVPRAVVTQPSGRQRVVRRFAAPVEAAPPVREASAAGAVRENARDIDPKFLPQEVAYDGPEKPGTIIISTHEKFLYLVEPDGRARRYGVGVGKEGFMWKGTEHVRAKKEWPGWTPPSEMIARERSKGRILPAHMEGGPANPLGARALYLGDTLYRIHGTNAPWTIGHNVSSGCIRLRNEDVIDLYGRVRVGAKVVVM